MDSQDIRATSATGESASESVRAATTKTIDPTRVSVIVTVLNERASIATLLESLRTQTLPPDEVVIVDGGSTDGTLEELEASAGKSAWPLLVLSRPGANISVGRNVAIEAAAGPIIASTDAGVRLEPSWLENLIAPIVGGATARVTAGFFVADPVGAFETALGAATLPTAGEIDPLSFLPSSRSVAFYKADWRSAGGYPEWLDYCEDLVFDFRLMEEAGAAMFAPEAVARFRPRPSLRAFWKQYFRYARGDGKADLWRARHIIRYATYLVAAPVLIALAISAHRAWALGLVVGLAAMLRRPIARLTAQWSSLTTIERSAALIWLPIIRVTGDLAKMAGYPAGLAWRIRHRPPEWRSEGSEAAEGAAMGRWLR